MFGGDPEAAPRVRHVYLVLSPRALPYARYALDSLFRNSLESLDLQLITDSGADRVELTQAVQDLKPPAIHRVKVFHEEELADREASLFGAYENIRAFRRGHPCWRKITDPLLLSGAGEELILLDPDLYFPNRFQFEETPANGILLMWQQPNCLIPAGVVHTALDSGIPLARHVDIGVAHWRAFPDLDWLDWALGKLGGAAIPRVMHVEAIVWSAIAMHSGGGHLDPAYWRCWRRTPLKRILRRCGTTGRQILSSEPWQDIKCFHAGGEAKWWLEETTNDGKVAGIDGVRTEHSQPGRIIPFVELRKQRFAREQALKSVVSRLGYHRLFGGG